MKVKLLLKEEVYNLGVTGDIVDVALGYARNYLMPRGIALEINASTQQAIEKAKKEWLAEEAARKDDMVALGEKLEGLEMVMTVRVSETGTLYGSVTAHQIGEALCDKGLDVKDHQIRLAHPIKEVGDHEVPVKLHSEVEKNIKVVVAAAVAEEEVVDDLHGDDTEQYGDGRDEEFDPKPRGRRKS